MSPPTATTGSLHISDPAIQSRIEPLRLTLREIGHDWSVSKAARVIKEYFDRQPPMTLMEFVVRKTVRHQFDIEARRRILDAIWAGHAEAVSGSRSHISWHDDSAVRATVHVDGDGWWKDEFGNRGKS